MSDHAMSERTDVLADSVCRKINCAGHAGENVSEVSPVEGPKLVRLAEEIDREDGALGISNDLTWLTGAASEYLTALKANDGGTYFAATVDGEILGFIGLLAGAFERTRGAFFVPCIGVAKAFRRRGIGELLLKGAELWARNRRAHRIGVRIPENNAAALALFRKCGFETEGRIADAQSRNGAWQAEISLGRTLKDAGEPRWDPVELAPRAEPVPLDTVEFRVPRPADARIMWTWEYELLTDSSVHLRLPYEMPAVPQLAKRLKAAAAPRRFSLAAFVDCGGNAAVVGHLQAAPNDGARDKDLTFRLNVAAGYWGSGTGRKLLEEFETWARQTGARRLSTLVLRHNSRGLRFADRCGFMCEAVAKDHALVDGRLTDGVLLGKVLT
jgi:GNAT superfamily N-acetyltransferase